MKLIIQIPCFNEEKTLPETINELPKIYLDALELYIERYLSIFPKKNLSR